MCVVILGCFLACSIEADNYFETNQDLETKFTLVHEFWTTKGNRFAFIGAAVAFIDSNWKYVVRHLALKMLPWRHHGHLLARPIVSLLKKGKLFENVSFNFIYVKFHPGFL
jgi:hypothetical protein